MTREEGLDWLYRLKSEIYVYMPKEWLIPMNNALDMAVSALSENKGECKECKWYDKERIYNAECENCLRSFNDNFRCSDMRKGRT